MDGTFEIVPSMYEQLYTIHGFDDATGWTLPAVYALLPNKTSKSYKKLLNIVVEQIYFVPRPHNYGLKLRLMLQMLYSLVRSFRVVIFTTARPSDATFLPK